MDRPLQIVFRDVQRSTVLTRLIRERARRLEHFHAHIIGCRVVAEASHGGPKSAPPPLAIAVEVEVPRRPKIVAKSAAARRGGTGGHSGMIKQVFDAVQRQLEQLARS